MAAIIASRKSAVSKLVEKLISSPSRRPIAAAATRSFNTGALREYSDDSDLERRPDSASSVSRRRPGDSFPSFQDVFDPFNPTRSLSQVLNMMDQMLDNPFFAAATGPRGAAGSLRRGWDAREDNDALHLRIDMPGLGKEQVKVWAEQNTLVIKGEGEKEPGEEGEEGMAGRRYSSRIDLPPESYKMDQIRAEMKNGVLKVMVPKVKKEERKDVFQVNID
ncbi:heat shock 22 kDa protein, mitochondrial isoform X2 [Canna indica]|uniref:Heat shock 22 kDa protein, mitochondrial isoform X2 n=1 Tax=Canna indica TaxID=4628 RepID=A0AAQ3JVP7_9LILI|nr:heat shock 22 kDa protein, mitochondrial isoform X2 [Canna indica]